MFKKNDVVLYLPSRRVLTVHENQNASKVACIDHSQTPSPILSLNPSDLVRVKGKAQGRDLAHIYMVGRTPRDI